MIPAAVVLCAMVLGVVVLLFIDIAAADRHATERMEAANDFRATQRAARRPGVLTFAEASVLRDVLMADERAAAEVRRREVAA